MARIEEEVCELKSQFEALRQENLRLKRSRERFLKGGTFLLAAMLTGVGAAALAAPGDQVPNRFQSGDTVSASAILENFDALSTQAGELKTQVEGLEGRIDLSRSVFYTREDSQVISGTADGISASCDDFNDIPVSGGCNMASNPGGWLIAENYTANNWSDTSSVGTYACQYNPNGASDVTISAYIVCINVP